MRRRIFGVGLALVAATAAAAAPRVDFRPTGAMIERSGFATILRAPHAPYPEDPPASQFQPRGEDAWYARDNGISIDVASKRRAEQGRIMPEFERLTATLRHREAGNYTSARMVHQPDWAYELYFKRDPEATLAKYTRNPRFVAKLARYSRAELEAILKPWADRFSARQLAGGWGVDDTYGTANIMMNVTEAEYRAIAATMKWGPVPDVIRLEFAGALPYQPVDPKVRPFLRAFAQNDRSTGVQLMAAMSGRIVLRDGCLYLAGIGGRPDSLAFFHRETGIGVDDAGYLILKDRATGQDKGRIGEWFTWAGPNGARPDAPGLKELRARCGSGPVAYVGNPESAAKFRARPNVVDTVVAERRVSRKRAWDILKQCWAREEKRYPDRPPPEICR